MRLLQLLSLTLALAWMGMIFFLSHQPSLPTPSLFPGQDKLFHAGAYGLLALLYLGSLPRHRPGHAGRQVLIVSLLAILYGVTDEFHQSFVPGRSPELLDLLADGVGAFTAAWLATLVKQRYAAR